MLNVTYQKPFNYYQRIGGSLFGLNFDFVGTSPIWKTLAKSVAGRGEHTFINLKKTKIGGRNEANKNNS